MKYFNALRLLPSIVVALIILCAGVVPAHATAQKASAVVPASQNAMPENTLLQFRAGGHILG